MSDLPLALALFFLIIPRKKNWFLPFFSGVLLIGLTQVRWLENLHLNSAPLSQVLRLLSQPLTNIVLGAAATLLILWALFRFFGSREGTLELARNLERRKDYSGAAQVMMDADHYSRALRLYQKAGDWKGAGEASERAEKLKEAAGFYRKNGGDSLKSAIDLYQRIGDKETAHACRAEYAQWLSNNGRLDDAIQMWVRSADYQRACRIAKTALNKGRLQPTASSFRAAKRAATETRDHVLLARLCELEGRWKEAGRFWSISGEHQKAASAYARATEYSKAADEEIRAGRLDSGAGFLLQSFRHRLKELPFGRRDVVGSNVSDELAKEAEKLIPLLEKLGREDDLIEVMVRAGKTEAAIDRLLQLDRKEQAAELAAQSRDWETAARLFEDLHRWNEAREAWEENNQLERAAQCAELAGENELALSYWESLDRPLEAARCLAQGGSLEDGIALLHAKGLLSEACELLRQQPGPVPDIPEIILDLAEYEKVQGRTGMAVAILQRAVLGVGVQDHRIGPALALARCFFEIGDVEKSLAQVERILAFDFSHSAAQELKQEIQRKSKDFGATVPATVGSVEKDSSTESVERYEIQHELGSGGMGVVYLARDTRLDRDVAIKVLRTTSEEEALQLRNEAMVAATLNHPGIVTIFDFEEGFDGYFIAMEFVPGKNLAELLKSDRQRVYQHFTSILLQTAEALAVAHDHQVIHRDLKPANILLTDDDRVKILDFGIATRIGTDSTSGGICGTPYYMAPEQIRGESPSPATDIYSLGATAFHLATGRPPFAKGNVIQAHLDEEPEDPCMLNPGLDPRLGSIILRCLEKEAERRFPDCRDLASALRSLQ